MWKCFSNNQGITLFTYLLQIQGNKKASLPLAIVILPETLLCTLYCNWIFFRSELELKKKKGISLNRWVWMNWLLVTLELKLAFSSNMPEKEKFLQTNCTKRLQENFLHSLQFSLHPSHLFSSFFLSKINQKYYYLPYYKSYFSANVETDIICIVHGMDSFPSEQPWPLHSTVSQNSC